METLLQQKCTCMNYGGNGANGTLTITADKIVFEPSSWQKVLLFWGDWSSISVDINQVERCEAKALWLMDIVCKNGFILHLNTFNKQKIVDIVDSLLQKQS